MIDPFGRHVSYLRVSVTDRCDFRCVYCMSENMSFLPKKDLLTLEELDRLCSAFVEKGVKKLRITGGEPLVRKNILWLFEALGRHLKSGALDELTLTTNGSQLPKYAHGLKDAGVERINISLDTLDAEKFKAITRWGDFSGVMKGIEAAGKAGLAIKINAVALKGVNEHEIEDLVRFAHGRGADLTLIETMPLGDIDGDRTDQYLPLSVVRARLMDRFTLEDIAYRTGGPARCVGVINLTDRIGGDRFTTGDRKLVGAIANQIGAAIETARLVQIEKTIHSAPNTQRYLMNQALIAIGGRSASLCKSTTAAAKRIGVIEVDHGDTSCKTPNAAESIANSWARAKSKGFETPSAQQRAMESMRTRC